jgi:hypothetical protein
MRESGRSPSIAIVIASSSPSPVRRPPSAVRRPPSWLTADPRNRRLASSSRASSSNSVTAGAPNRHATFDQLVGSGIRGDRRAPMPPSPQRPTETPQGRQSDWPNAACARHEVDQRVEPFHVKHGRWIRRRPPFHPQARQAIYVVFHVKRQCLWITSVDNFFRGSTPPLRRLRRTSGASWTAQTVSRHDDRN